MRRSLPVAALLACVCVTAARPQVTPDAAPKPAVVRLDSALVFKPIDDSKRLTQCFQQNTARPFSAYLATNALRVYGLERYELSRFQCTLYGADMGLTVGLIAGAAGMMAGAFGETEAWYTAGAAAALGALFGGAVKADDPSFRVRLRWENTDPYAGRR